MKISEFNLVAMISLAVFMSVNRSAEANDMQLSLRYQTETSSNSGRFHRLSKTESWNPRETAVIVCDVWDYHHCLNAVRRLEQFAPRINDVLKKARQLGATIIHSPSDCMDAYKQHAARQRAIAAPVAKTQPAQVKAWCSRIPSEERAVYPIDQSDGGEDDDPREHAEWAAKLKALGRNPGLPWGAQSKLIEIDADRDFISDRGDEVWNILEARGIKNVILTGVHVNMCVLGRPFGLRQMVRNRKNVVLMRDMTDTMYNPKRWPYVSHFTGNDLVISHIERFVCPTITSDQILGGKPFRFKRDKRPHLLVVVAEDGYRLNETIPRFTSSQLGHNFRISYAYGSESERNHIPGLDVLEDADVLLLAVRRRLLPKADMARLKRFVKAGKPVVGLRTSSHAFSIKGDIPAGLAEWSTFDADVFGGNYHGDHNNKTPTVVWQEKTSHATLTGVTSQPFTQGGSLYKTSPLANKTQILLASRIGKEAPEPVAWTFNRADGGRSFYSSLGHVDDFENPVFVKLLHNALAWSANIKPTIQASGSDHWNLVKVPVQEDSTRAKTWYRCVVNVPAQWASQFHAVLPPDTRAWINGHEIKTETQINNEHVYADDYNLFVIQTSKGLIEAPVFHHGAKSLRLEGRWQSRSGSDESWSNIPLPAKFGGSTDIVHELR